MYAALPRALSAKLATDAKAFTVAEDARDMVPPLTIDEDECVGVVHPLCNKSFRPKLLMKS